MVLDLAAHKDKGVYRLKAVDDIFQTLEENQVVLSAMKSTRYSCPNTKIIINLYFAKKTVQYFTEYLQFTNYNKY